MSLDRLVSLGNRSVPSDKLHLMSGSRHVATSGSLRLARRQVGIGDPGEPRFMDHPPLVGTLSSMLLLGFWDIACRAQGKRACTCVSVCVCVCA